MSMVFVQPTDKNIPRVWGFSFYVSIMNLLGALGLPLPAFAQSQLNSIILNLTGTIRLVITLAGTTALLVFVWGIVKLIAAANSPEKIREAKGIIWWGIIGLSIMASIIGLVIFLQTYFGVTGGNISVPQFDPL